MTLRDAIDQDVFKIDGIEYTEEQIQAMSLEELETLKMLITKKLSGMAASLREKCIQYKYNRKGTKPSWYLKIKSAQSIHQRVLAYLNSIVRTRVRSGRVLGDYFIDKAKAFLPAADFEFILQSAQREMREGV